MSVWLNAVSTSIVLVYVMLITPNTCLKWSVVADKPLYLVFKSNQWFDLWLVGLPPTGCRFKVDLIHTDPNQASKSGQTYRFRSQSPVGWPMFSLIKTTPSYVGSAQQVQQVIFVRKTSFCKILIMYATVITVN